jgi:RimJ/RimL family protein N-acetyltransferase
MLRGERIVLRAIEREDLPNYVRWFNDERVLAYFGRYVPMSMVQEEKWYESMLDDPSVVNFAVELEQEHIGGAGFCGLDGKNRSAEVGLFVGLPELWGQGLGRDILQTLIAFGFDQLNLNRISLRVFADNKRAVHLYEKVGFNHEGCWRQAEFRHGRYQDMLWMSILRHEWENQKDPSPQELG